MSDDFIMQQQLRPQKEKACFHCCLSFYPGEKPSDDPNELQENKICR